MLTIQAWGIIQVTRGSMEIEVLKQIKRLDIPLPIGQGNIQVTCLEEDPEMPDGQDLVIK